MTSSVVRLLGIPVLAYEPDGAPLPVAEATDLVGEAWGHGVDVVSVPADRCPDEFFDLSSGLAGELAQKFVNYRLRLAIVGDISRHVAASRALRDFVAETNRGGQVWFVATRDELVRRLGQRGGEPTGPYLSHPTVGVRSSFRAAMAEFRAEGRGGPDDDTMIGGEIRAYGADWSTPTGFAHYVRWLTDQAREESPRPAGHVPATSLWWVDEDEYLGRIAIRHRLAPALREVGGHIGYDVRPSARRRGHATAMLRAALPVARRLGIESALITCEVGNVASRKVIEHNGGVLADERHGYLRFWMPT